MPKVSVKEKNRLRHRKYYEENKEHVLAKVKEWIKNNPERAKKNLDSRRKKYFSGAKGIYHVLKQNSKKRKHDIGMSQSEFVSWHENQVKVCHYCDKPQGEKRLEIDRMDNSLGYNLNNIVLACHDCNGVKSNILSYSEMVSVGEVVMKARWSN